MISYHPSYDPKKFTRKIVKYSQPLERSSESSLIGALTASKEVLQSQKLFYLGAPHIPLSHYV
jgi:hypothetical protein